MTAIRFVSALSTILTFITLVAFTASADGEHELDVYLKEHIRTLDAGRDVTKLQLPTASRQASGGTCISTSRCLAKTRTCGSFKCPFCSVLSCLPVRRVPRDTTISEITCERSPCETDLSNPARNCCTRQFCITDTCKPAVLDPVNLDGKTVGDTITVPTAVQVPTRLPLDLYLLTDTTGSMAGEIKSASEGMVTIIERLRGEITEALAFGVGEFRDEEELSGGFRNIQSLDIDDKKAIRAAKSLVGTARGGGDGPEGGLAALYQLTTNTSIGWRLQARKIVVLFGDNAQHEPTCVAAKVLRRADVIKALNALKISVVTVSFRPGLDSLTSEYKCGVRTTVRPTLPGNQAKDISAQTLGFSTSLKTDGIKEIVRQLVDAVKNVELQLDVFDAPCEDALKVEYSPELPISVNQGDIVRFNQKITIKPGACDIGLAECVTYFTVRGPRIAEQEIITDGVVCPA